MPSDPAGGVIYLMTYGAKLLAFHPQERGIGPVEDLGGIYDAPGRAPYTLHTSEPGARQQRQTVLLHWRARGCTRSGAARS